MDVSLPIKTGAVGPAIPILEKVTEEIFLMLWVCFITQELFKPMVVVIKSYQFEFLFIIHVGMLISRINSSLNFYMGIG